MARIRTIKPDFWKHEELSALPEATHMLAAALLNYADDEGYFNANTKLIKAECFPLREPSVSIHDGLTALSSVGYLRLGKSPDGKIYGHIIKFNDHQRVNRPITSKIKNIEILWEDSHTTHTQLTEPSLPEGKGREEERKGNGKEGGAVAPTTKFAFEGKIIRLDQNQLDTWRKSYSAIPDIRAELTKADAYYAEHPPKDGKWFFVVSRWLDKAHNDILAARRREAEPRVMVGL